MLRSFLLIIISSFATACSFAQDRANMPASFLLTGTLRGRDSGILILWYPDSTGTYRRDTTIIQNGDFHFTGFVNEPSYVHLIGVPQANNYASFFLEAGNQYIELEQNKFSSFRMSGSASQTEADTLKQEIDLLKSGSDTLTDVGTQSATINFISTHPSSYVSATQLLGIINRLSLAEAEALYHNLNLIIQNSRTGLLCYAEIQKKKKINSGTIAPDFETTDYKKRAIALHQFTGKYVLLDFWASWCIPCRQSVPALLKIYSKYHKQGLEYIAIADDDNKEMAWKKAIKKDKTKKWNHVLNGIIKKPDGSVITTKSINHKYGVEVLPTKILINRDNTIIGIFRGSDEEKKMYKVLKELFEK